MIKNLLHPFSIYLIGLSAVVILFYFKKIRLVNLLFILSFLWLLISSFGFLPNLLVESLESKYSVYHPSVQDSCIYHILVLGGGHVEDERLPPNGQLNLTALGRLAEGIRLFRLLPNSKLVLSGYSPSGRTPQAEILKRTALLLGVDNRRTLLQVTPTNTYEEAKEYSKKYGNNVKLIVVTSATHMSRAIEMFKGFDLDPIPAPTNFLIKGNGEEGSWRPSVTNMDNMHTAFKEYIALWTADWRN
jgi:uncharacterized SAM-binding protein YcdF (DUF218 family)